MNKKNIPTNGFSAWLLASRPKTLAGAAVPVVAALALAARDNGFSLQPVSALLCLLFAVLMQVDANFVNDYFDWRRGNDDESTRLGPLRACSQGWVTPRAMIVAMVLTTLVACAVGLPLVLWGGWKMIAVGAACVVFCVLYTTTLSYIGMGDVLVLAFFGIVPVCCTHFLQTGVWSLEALALGVASGLAIDCLLVVNNFRDIDNDRRDGKRTLVVMIGREKSLVLYNSLGSLAALIVLWLCGFTAGSVVCMFGYYFFHLNTAQEMRRLRGRQLNKTLGQTARNILIFGALAAVALVMA